MNKKTPSKAAGERDVIIVGGGIAGAALAYGLAGKGCKATVLDAPTRTNMASRTNVGLIWCQSKFLHLPEYARWGFMSSRLFPELVRELEEISGLHVPVNFTGGLIPVLDGEDFQKRADYIVKLREALGEYRGTVIERAELEKKLPKIAFGPEVCGAAWCEDDGVIDPLALLRAYRAALPRLGAEYVQTLVLDVAPHRDGYRVSTRDGDYFCRRLVLAAEKSLNEFAISDACDAVSDFIDVLTNWYIRNTRDRFWNEDASAFNTLYTVLEAFMRVLAPLAPMEAESVWRGLTGGESVHLADWPFVVDEKTGEDTELGRVLVDDPALVDAMEKVREVVSGTLSLRKAAKIRVRQPLSKLTVVAGNVEAVKAYDDLLKAELNIKNIEFSTLQDAAAHGLKIVHELRVNARAAGPRLGKQVQFAIKASKSGDWHVDAASGAPVVSTPSGDLALVEGEYELINRVEEENATEAAASVSASLPTGGFVILDTALDADLLAEGYARDVIRSVQDARKAADLDIADRISLVLTVPADDVAKVEQFKDLIAHETLATSFEVKEGAELAVEVVKA